MKTRFLTLILIMFVSMIGYTQSVEVKTFAIQSRLLKFTTNIPIKSYVVQLDSGNVYFNPTLVVMAGSSLQAAITAGKLALITKGGVVSMLADTAHFGTVSSGARDKYIRKKILGVRPTDVFAVTAINASTTALTGIEAIGYYCVADSLIISRSAATTAGMAVSYIRVNK